MPRITEEDCFRWFGHRGGRTGRFYCPTGKHARALGIGWPLTHGWMSRLVGSEVTKERFESANAVVRKVKRPKPIPTPREDSAVEEERPVKIPLEIRVHQLEREVESLRDQIESFVAQKEMKPY